MSGPGCKCLVFSALAQAARSGPKIKWCLKSDQELKKCTDLATKTSELACVKRDGSEECIRAVKVEHLSDVSLHSVYCTC